MVAYGLGVGSHRDSQSPLARFRRWLRYRRYLADLRADEPKPISLARDVLLQAMARMAARRAEDGHE